MSNASAVSVVESDDLQRQLERALHIGDEEALDPWWTAEWQLVREYVLRPAKRVRPALVLAGYQLAQGGSTPVPEDVSRFAAGLELLHAFLLVHDDVADRAETRRGGPALHRLTGDNLAVVIGDHLYARALEVMLSTRLPAAVGATRYLLGVCRHTAVGQALDLSLAGAPLSEVTLFQTLRVATLKTARYGFVAPLVCGAMLGGAKPDLLDALSRVGRHAGTAFQLRDDLLGLFGDDQVIGKSGWADYLEGKRTFPVIAAWTRADDAGRARLEQLWAQAPKDEAACRAARAEVDRHGGRQATERAIARSTRAAVKALASIPSSPARAQLDALLRKLAHRSV